MTSASVSRLLGASASAWTAHLDKNPHWGVELAQCLREGSVSPLGVTNNLRKLSDCMAHPDVQPLLCDWLGRYFAPRSCATNVSQERVNNALGRCVRAIQLQAIAQGHSVCVLPRFEALSALTGSPQEGAHIWEQWTLKEEDIYTVASKKGLYFTNGQPLGDLATLKTVLSRYQKMLIESMVAHPAMAKKIEDRVHFDTPHKVMGMDVRLAHALLWEHARLSTPMKYALAQNWANDASPWSTRQEDMKLSPQKTRHWQAMASHAQTYLDLSGKTNPNFQDALWALRSCPPMPKPIEQLDNVDAGLFTDGGAMV